MSSTPEILSDLPVKICDRIKGILPGLRTCEPHAGKFSLEELKKNAIPTPAVLVSTLGGKQGKGHGGPGSWTFDLSMAAFVVTRGSLGKQRDVYAANICQVLLQLVPDQRWGEPAAGEAKNVVMQPLISTNSRDYAASLWSVTWTQPVTFYARPQSALGVELYVSQAPAVGADHEADYQLVEGTDQ